jgi:hypothetical protein
MFGSEVILENGIIVTKIVFGKVSCGTRTYKCVVQLCLFSTQLFVMHL